MLEESYFLKLFECSKAAIFLLIFEILQPILERLDLNFERFSIKEFTSSSSGYSFLAIFVIVLERFELNCLKN
jgi:hypothetical protein